MQNPTFEILEQFLHFPLTRTNEVFDFFRAALPTGIYKKDGDGPFHEFFFYRGNREDKIAFIAHADTVWDFRWTHPHEFRGLINAQQPEHDIRYDEKNHIFRSGTNAFGIGADDRAGCAMAFLLKDLGHSILITSGEEHEQVGSQWIMNSPENRDIADILNREHQFLVQLDRRNGTDFKTYEVGTPDFIQYVRTKTGFTFQEGSRTDIIHLARDICGVNFSIGYHCEHHSDEILSFDEWLHTLDLCKAWLGPIGLPRFPR